MQLHIIYLDIRLWALDTISMAHRFIVDSEWGDPGVDFR